MSFFSWPKKTKQSIGLIDLGSGSVSLVIVNSTGQIIWSALKTFKSRASDNLETFLTEAEDVIKTSLAEIPLTLNPKPEKYQIILPAPLFLAVSKTLSQNSDQAWLFDQTKLDVLASKSASDYLAKEPLLFSVLKGDKNVLIENKVMSLEINGYPMKTALRQKIKFFRAKQYLSLGSKKVLSRLADAVKVSTQVNQIKFATFPLLAYQALDHLLEAKPDDYLILDAGGELTDLIAVHNRHFSSHFSFPYGLNYLLKKIATGANTNLTEAGESLRLYYEGKLETKARDRLTDILVVEQKIWLDYFIQALKKISEQTFIFPHIYLLGDDYANFFFREFLRDEAIQALVINRGSLRLSTAESLLNLLPKELKMNSSASPLLRLVAVFLANNPK
ncbi:hypothetical protein BK005_01515 [bacterium CG10_37_50]|nr:MAG: hypothetical protein BK005_01515 [bacterium CG10_37_50]